MEQTPKTYTARPRWLKVLLDIWENRSRTALVVASIAVGVFAVGMIISTYVILATDMEESYGGSNPANIQIRTRPFDEDFVKIIAKLPGVRQVEGRNRTSLRLSQDEGETWRSLRVIAIDDFENSEIFIRESVEGKTVPADREILLESRILEEFDVEVGETLQIQLSSGTVRELEVTGLVRDQSIEGGPNAQAVAYITMDTLTWLGQEPSFNRLMITVEGDNIDLANIEAVSQIVEDRLEESNMPLISVINSPSNEHPSSVTVLAILSVLGAMGGLMLVLGGSLIANTLTALLNQQMRQIGVMKLVGARNLQVISMYLVLIILLGLISLVVSIPLAAWGGYQFALFFGDLLSISIGSFRFVPRAIVVQALIAIFIPILAGIFPVISGSRLTVEEAISDDSASKDGGSGRFFEKLGESMEWISRPLLISIRNTFRNVRRLSLTLFTLTVAGGIFIAVFNMQASLNNFIGSVTGLFKADISVSLSRPYREIEIASLVESIPGVADTEMWLSALGDTPKGDGSDIVFTIQAPPAASDLIAPNITQGRFLQEGDTNAIVVAETIWADLPELKAGDTIEMGINDGRAEEWTVVGIFSFPERDADFILSYAPYEIISQQTNNVGRGTVLKVVLDEQTLVNQERYANTLDTLFQDEGIRFESIEEGMTTLESVSEAISTLVSFFLGMAVLTAVVGSIGLAGTMSMNVMERIREIGILRAIGAVDSAVMSSVLVEGVFIGFISWLLGIAVCVPISYGLLTMVSLAITNSVMPMVFSATGFWLWFLVIIGLSAIASIIPARNASRLTIREVLAYE